MQYEPLTLFFVFSPFVLAYYSGVAMQGSGASQTRIWTIALTEFVFIARAMFIVNDKDGACLICYTGSLRFDHVSWGLLFRLPAKILDSLVYFGLYKATIKWRQIRC